jgi:hypothetical protein
MKRTLCLLIALIGLAGLIGCSYESRSTTLHEPGVYKGGKDQVTDQQKQQELIDRFRLVQTDR